MYHSFFIHSSVDGHLGCFRVLAIVNSAAMNIGLHVHLHYYLLQSSCCTLDPQGFWILNWKSVLLDQIPPICNTAQSMATTLEFYCFDLTYKWDSAVFFSTSGSFILQYALQVYPDSKVSLSLMAEYNRFDPQCSTNHLCLLPCSGIRFAQLIFFPPRLSVVQGPSLVLYVNLHLCAHICVILILREIARIKIGTQPKLTHSHTCFNSGGNEETKWYVLKHWSKNMTQYSRELLERLWRGPHSSTLAWKIPWTEEPVGCSPWGHWELDRLSDFTFTFHFHALEKEMATHSSVLAWRIPGTGAWWAAVYGVAQSRTRLTWLGSW